MSLHSKVCTNWLIYHLDSLALHLSFDWIIALAIIQGTHTLFCLIALLDVGHSSWNQQATKTPWVLSIASANHSYKITWRTGKRNVSPLWMWCCFTSLALPPLTVLSLRKSSFGETQLPLLYSSISVYIISDRGKRLPWLCPCVLMAIGGRVSDQHSKRQFWTRTGPNIPTCHRLEVDPTTQPLWHLISNVSGHSAL